MKLFELKSYPRSIMPQIHAKDLKDKYDFVKAKVSIKDMIPVQKERLQKEYEDAIIKVKNNCAKPIMLDKHGKIVNGHHRHDAYRDLGFDKVKVIVVNATLDDLIQAFSEEAGGGGGGAGAGGAGAGGSGAGASAGGDGGSTGSSGDGGSADSGDTGSSDSAPTTSGSMRGGFFLGSMSPYKKKKKKKKKSNFQFGKGVYKEGDLLVNLGLLESAPNFDFEWEEARRYPEFEKLGKEVWIEMAKRGKEVEITSAKDINNTDAANPENFYELDPAKQKRAMQALSRGKMEMPIVAQYSDGHKELIGGNTRLTYAMLRQGKAKIWLFNVPDSIAENAMTWKKFDVKLGYRANMMAWLLQQNYNLRKAGQEEIPKIKADDAFTKAMLDAGITPEQLTQAREVDYERRKEADDMWAKSWRAGNNAKGIVRNERKKYGKGIFETIEAMQDLQALLKAIDEDLNERNLNPDVKDYVKGKKTKLIKVKVADLDDDAIDDRFGRVIDVDPDVGVDLDEPILLDVDGKTILDGFHRVYQAKRVGRDVIPAEIIDENFADGKKKGKSRPGRVKRAGASCKGSVSSLRAKAKKYSGERGKMYHWCANMKGGKKKK